MKINRNNYEAFFLDYHEGSLGEELKREVLAFVSSNPDLKGEFESFEIISLREKSRVTFAGKEKLKKSVVNEYNYKTFFVACLENDVDEHEKKAVEEFLRLNPDFSVEFEILKQV